MGRPRLYANATERQACQPSASAQQDQDAAYAQLVAACRKISHHLHLVRARSSPPVTATGHG